VALPMASQEDAKAMEAAVPEVATG